MTTAIGDDLAGWSIGVAEEVDIPGWLYLPADLSTEEQDTWLDEAGTALVDLIQATAPQLDLPPTIAGQVREVLQAGLSARAESTCELMYQVWPVAGPAAVLCEVNATRTEELPDWKQMPGRVHDAVARHIGPGLQYSTRRVVDEGDGPEDLSAVHFVFADASYAFLLSLQEGPSPLIAQALTPLAIFKDALAVVREDGELFSSTPVVEVIEDSAWPVDEEEVS